MTQAELLQLVHLVLILWYLFFTISCAGDAERRRTSVEAFRRSQTLTYTEYTRADSAVGL